VQPNARHATHVGSGVLLERLSAARVALRLRHTLRRRRRRCLLLCYRMRLLLRCCCRLRSLPALLHLRLARL
jgi:hypothetical protein